MATNVSDFVIPRFHPVLGDVMAHGHTHHWLPGGRGSTKSSFISIAIVLLVIANPKANAVVVRRFSNTLRDSVYQQIQWAIEVLGLEGVFRRRVSPMEITYTPTGQRIVFRGADDPLKLKGVKLTRGYCGVVWFEELDQFEGVETVRSHPQLPAPWRRQVLDCATRTRGRGGGSTWARSRGRAARCSTTCTRRLSPTDAYVA